MNIGERKVILRDQVYQPQGYEHSAYILYIYLNKWQSKLHCICTNDSNTIIDHGKYYETLTFAMKFIYRRCVRLVVLYQKIFIRD